VADRSLSTERLLEVVALFLRLGLTSFGGPAAHVALMQRECVERRQWIARDAFLDMLAVSSLVPGPTSTELAMHIGRHRAGWPGLVLAGLAFIAPAALAVGLLAAVYVRTGDLSLTQGIMAAVTPVAVLLVAQAMIPLGRAALRSPALTVIAAAAGAAVVAGAPELLVLLAAGVAGLAQTPSVLTFAAFSFVSVTLGAAGTATRAPLGDVVTYFLGVGAVLFGSGYVLFPVLEGDLVGRLGWLTERELLDAIAAGQATPGPVFTTATFIGYLLGGPSMAVAATVAMFAPAFVFSAVSSVALDRLKASRAARAFLDGVNAAAVAMIAVVVVALGRSAFTGVMPVLIGLAAAVALFAARVNPMLVMLAAALAGAAYGLIDPAGG
jgi:chromate transporter